jgi:signal transduction histidine kinase
MTGGATQPRREQPIELLRLLQEVTVLANEADSIEAALRPSMELILERNGWVLGHACMAAEDEPHLFVDSGLWVPEPPRGFEPFVEASRTIAYREGPTLVGELIGSGEPRWIRDVSNEPDFARSREAASVGLRGGFFFPIFVRERVAGVLEFFSRTELEPEPRLRTVMARAGTQLGRVVERLELERQLDVVAAREQRRLGRELHDGIGQTLLENALEHAHADRIDLRLHQADGVLTLEIRDDGRGMEGHPRNAEGAGLRIMRHRAAICGAGLEVSSGPNQGTVVRCRLRLLRGNAAR